MAIMYMTKEKEMFSCPKEHISLYMNLSVLKQFTLSKTLKKQISTLSLVNSIDQDQMASSEAS